MSEAPEPAPRPAPTPRGQWSSRLGFVLAAAGSAVGLGNIWKFPYVTGENGGGLFVLIYLVCIAVVGLPIMVAEVLVGRATQSSPVGAFGKLTGPTSLWRLIGWLGVASGFVILSYYSVVAGWAMNYTLMSASRFFEGKDPTQIADLFGTLYTAGDINLFWHGLFMTCVVGIVVGGVSRGIERAARILMPVLFVLLGFLLVDAAFQKGFVAALDFLFRPRADKLTAAGILEALGHSFFTLSLGMGAMLTYGSYLPRNTDVVKASVLVSFLDTLVAVVACLVLFPIIFSFGMEAQAGPGLVFKSMPIAFSQMPGGMLLSLLFFFLIFFAALTSAISLLEVVASYFIDERGWTRRRAAALSGIIIFLFGIPSALAGAGGLFSQWETLYGENFFDTMDYLASNWMLPLGGLAIAVYVGWFMPADLRKEEFTRGSAWAKQYGLWLFFLRFVAPVAILILFLFSVEILPKTWLSEG